MRGPRRGCFSVKRKMASLKAYGFEIEIERRLHGENQINKVLGDNIEIHMSLGRSGKRDFRY